MYRKSLLMVLIFLAVLTIFPYRPGFADEKLNMKEFREEWTVERYTKYFYNRYSVHFDERGFFYMVPDYGINYWKTPKTAREHMAFAMYYKYRAKDGDPKALEILDNALAMARREISARPSNTQSFEDAEAIFLMVRVLDEVFDGFNDCDFKSGMQSEKLEIENWKLGKGENGEESRRNGALPRSEEGRDVERDDKQKLEIDDFLRWISEYAEYGLRVPDTENRAIISAVHWQYIIDYLSAKGFINTVDRKRYEKILKDKIDFAIKTNIKDYWYVEGRFNDFTPHYHAVAAYMLMIYSKLTADNKYARIARKMYENLKSVSFDNGMVEAELGHRPCGLGAQFYLMAGILGKAFDDPDYTAYLFYGFGDRFFSDPDYPNRLEYHPTIEQESQPAAGDDFIYNDDYSFADKAEFALAIPSLGGDGKIGEVCGFNTGLTPESTQKTGQASGDIFNFTYQILIPEIIPQKKFIQKNTGREITFNGKKFILGSFGNYSSRVK